MNYRGIAAIVLGFFVSHTYASGDLNYFSQNPNSEAPAELKQFGQFVGSWRCKSSSMQPDATWKDYPGHATWSWFYVLNGYAIQDIWQPGPEAPPTAGVGTNIRVLNKDTGEWTMVWTTNNHQEFEHYTSKYINDTMVMRAEMPARGPRQAHLAKITFHNIEEKTFDWKYEFSPIGDGDNWTEASRLACTRNDK